MISLGYNTATEESDSGPFRGFAKPLSLNKARVGSNPTSSATEGGRDGNALVLKTSGSNP